MGFTFQGEEENSVLEVVPKRHKLRWILSCFQSYKNKLKNNVNKLQKI